MSGRQRGVATPKVLAFLLVVLAVCVVSYFAVRGLIKRILVSEEVRREIIVAIETALHPLAPKARLDLATLNLEGLKTVSVDRAVVLVESKEVFVVRDIRLMIELMPLLRYRRVVAQFLAKLPERSTVSGGVEFSLPGREDLGLAISAQLVELDVAHLQWALDHKAVPVLAHLQGQVDAELSLRGDVGDVRLDVKSPLVVGLHKMVPKLELSPMTAKFRYTEDRLTLQEPLRFESKLFNVAYEGSFSSRGGVLDQDLRVTAKANPVLVSYYAGAMGCPKEKVNFGQIFGKSVTRRFNITGKLGRPHCEVAP